MKGTNLCEWLRGIILVRAKKKNGLKMLLFKGEERENGTEYMLAVQPLDMINLDPC